MAGQVGEVRYGGIVKSTDNGHQFQFGNRLVWISRGCLYNHNRQDRTILIPESLILEKVLDPFRVCVFAKREKITVSKSRFKLLEVKGAQGKAQCLDCNTVFDFAAPSKNCIMVQRYEVVPMCPGCGPAYDYKKKEKDDATGDKGGAEECGPGDKGSN